MADKTDVKEVVEAAAVVAEAASDAAATELNAEAAIEAAEEKIEAAEELAEQITDAALRTELGRMVTDIREDFEKWRNENLGLIESLRSEMLALREMVNSMTKPIEPAPQPVLVVPAETPLTPPASPEPEAIPGTVIAPANAPVAEAVPVVVVPAQKPTRRFL